MSLLDKAIVLATLAALVIYSCNPRDAFRRWWTRHRSERRDFSKLMSYYDALEAMGRVSSPRCVPDPVHRSNRLARPERRTRPVAAPRLPRPAATRSGRASA